MIKRKKIIIGFLVIFSLVILFMLVFFKIDFTTLMGNSTLETYYYCEDPTFKLSGSSCYRKNKIEPLILGDVNKDGTVSVIDVTEIEKYINKLQNLDENQLLVADVNFDGVVNSEDETLLKKNIVGLKYTETVINSLMDKYNIGDKICPKGYSSSNNGKYCVMKQVVKAKKISFIYGDINQDEKIDNKDLILLQNYLTGDITLNEIQKKAADINSDGVIDLKDKDKLQGLILNGQEKIDVKISLLDNVDISNISANTNLNYRANFNINSKEKYYYMWFDLKSNTTLKSKCMLASKQSDYKISATDNNEYVLLKIYKDSDCTDLVNMYSSDLIKISNKNEISDISIDYRLINPILTTTVVNKNTKLVFNAKFNVIGTNNYYYKWNAIKNDVIYNEPLCTKVIDGKIINPHLTINGKNQYGRWDIYNDSSCSPSSFIKSYSTDKYNYFADKIQLNIKSTRLNVGSMLKLHANITSSLNNANQYIKWTSSDVSVATVDNKGVVTAKKKGTTTITVSIGNLKTTSVITVVNISDDDSIACPMLQYNNTNGLTNISVSPNDTIKKYDVYISTNDHVGSYAKYILRYSGFTGKKNINNYYNNYYSNQIKIVVYSKSGTSRNCYTPPLTWKWNTPSVVASCPSFSYSYNKSNSVYNYKNGNYSVTSGINKMNISYKIKNEYQYSWYTSQKDESYKLFLTYKSANKSIQNSVTGQLYDRNGQVVVTDKYGNSIVCKTNYINNISLAKSNVGGTNIYYEKGYPKSDYNTVISQMKKMNSISNSYLAASNLFLYTDKTYGNLHGNSCGVYLIGANNIAIRQSKKYCGGSSQSSYFKGVVEHEFGHSIDFMHDRLKGISLAKSTYNKKQISDYTKKYENKKLCNSNYCLRYNGTYSYGTSYWEFVADLFSYKVHGFKIDKDLVTLRNRMMNLYSNTYKKNKSKFNKIKESFK